MPPGAPRGGQVSLAAEDEPLLVEPARLEEAGRALAAHPEVPFVL